MTGLRERDHYSARHRGSRRLSGHGLQIGFGVLITLGLVAVLAVLAQTQHRAPRTSASIAALGPNSAAATPTPPVTTYAVPRTAAGATVPPAGSTPTFLSIPEIGVASQLQPLGLLADGSLQPPSAWLRAGWYEHSARAGQPGPVVIAGHIDSTSGPAVFYRLQQLRAGDHVSVHSQNGGVFGYQVDSTASYPKSGFPDAAVYGPTAVPTLRLISCAGDFDYATKSYLDNVVVSAHLVSGPTG